MPATLARQRYLLRHIEADLPTCPLPGTPWCNVLVIPAYRESGAVLKHLSELGDTGGRTLVILVLNRPDSDPDEDANTILRKAVASLPAGGHQTVKSLSPHTDIFLHDLDRLVGGIPADRGVGLARKTGCDIALKWLCAGAISSRWICSTDADAQLPPDYFDRLATAPATAVAVTFPFRHAPGADLQCNLATALYELRLHHYVLGLEYAQSPYACHTLGSCLAVTPDAYAQVRGIPRRAGAEDFYLLNKLAKIAPVTRLAGACVQLESRASSRVPFGTGPAVAKIRAAPDPRELALYEHPACFEALRCLLLALPALRPKRATPLSALLVESGLDEALALASEQTVADLGLAAALQHCRRQAKTPQQFMRQFHQWFDGFRTLKFLHGLRDQGWPDQSLTTLSAQPPRFWPAADSSAPATLDLDTLDPDTLRDAIASTWGWCH